MMMHGVVVGVDVDVDVDVGGGGIGLGHMQQNQRKAETLIVPHAKEFQTTTAVIDPTVVEHSANRTVRMDTSTAAPSTAVIAGVVLSVCCEHIQQQQQLRQQQQQQRNSVGVLNTVHFPAHHLYHHAPTQPTVQHAQITSKQLATLASTEKYFAEYQRCWPPPLFIILISLLEIGVFVYDYMTIESASSELRAAVSSESWLIYRPDRRLELWRFVSYMMLHANWFHLSFNVAVQLLYGLPLEIVHGSARIVVVYLAGVLAGSLGTSVVDSTVYLVGASGGVYALLAAQLAHVVLNFGHMRSGMAQLISVCIFVACDLGYALYSKYMAVDAVRTLPTVSYIAHMTGSLAGFTLGLLVLKNFDGKTRTRLIWWLSLGIYAAFNVFAIVFNLINTMTAQMLAVGEGDVIKQRLFHDLNIS